YTYGDCYSNAYTYSDCYSNAYTYSDCYTHFHCYSYRNPNCNGDGNRNSHCNIYTNCHRNCNANSDARPDTDCAANSDPTPDTHGLFCKRHRPKLWQRDQHAAGGFRCQLKSPRESANYPAQRFHGKRNSSELVCVGLRSDHLPFRYHTCDAGPQHHAYSPLRF